MYKYEYKFVEIERRDLKGFDQDFKKVIREYAEKGWRFVQLIPEASGFHDYLPTDKLTLIFEKTLA